MRSNRALLRCTIAAMLLAAGVALIAPVASQERKRHKFFLGQAPKHEDSEVITQMIFGDEDTEGLFTFMNDTWKVGFQTPMHYHKTHYEVFYLKAGEAEWTVNGETHRMKAGDAVLIPPNSPHNSRTLGSRPAEFLMFYLPGSYEAHLQRERQYTEEQRKDPKIRDMLRQLNDFHLVVK